MSNTTTSGSKNDATTSQAKQNPSAEGGAQALRANAGAAKKCAPSNKNGKCGFCERDGYPILPLRYAVVPSYLQNSGTLPLSAVPTFDSFEKKGLRLSKYVLRTLRQGFVHVYLGTPGIWQSYVVTKDGYLRLLADPDDPDWKTDRPMTEACKRDGHNIPASFITVPPGYDKVWLAFAEDVWSPTVRANYEKAPDKRMQQCQISALASAPGKTKHAFEIGGGKTGLTDLVFEYVDEERKYAERRSYDGGYWSEKGTQKTQKGHQWQSLHGNFSRAGHGAPLTKFASSFAEKRSKSGKPGKVAAFALRDDVGIVKELNGHTHDRIQWRQTYCGAIARPLLISQAIVGLKTQISQATAKAVEEDETKRKVADKVTTTYVVGNPNYTPDAVQTVTTTRKERIDAKNKANWSKLEERYNEAERDKFEKAYVKQMSDLTERIADCDADWEAWARTNEWKSWLGDYDVEKLHENVKLMKMCAPCLAGGPQGKAGVKLWEEWLTNEKDANNPTGYTIPYAAIMGGRKDLLTYLAPAGPKPWDGDEVNKGDKLYDTVKAIISADEFKDPEKLKKLMDPVQQAAAHLLAALDAAISQVSERAAQAAEGTARRAIQAGFKIYRNISPVFLKVRMTIGQYVDLMNQLSRKGADAGKRLTEVSGRRARSVVLGGILSISNEKVRNTVIEVTIWTFEQAEELKKTIEASVAKAKREALDIAGGAASALKIAGMTLSRDAVQLLRPLERSVMLLPGAAKSLAREIMSKGMKAAAIGGEPLLAVGSLMMQVWAFRDSRKEMDTKLGPQGGAEAKLPVVSAALGIMAATAEVTKIGLGMFGKPAAGPALVKVGGMLAAVSLAVDGVQALFSANRAAQQGDRGAAWAYGVGAGAFILGAVVSVATGFSGALVGGLLGIGPLGWVLLLTAAGIAMIWLAVNLESTPAEVWLDRCYWGLGKRAEGKWTDSQFNEEIADLNALVLGLGAELAFNDDWTEAATGFDTLKVKLTFANYSAAKSVYEWKVRGVGGKGNSEIVMAGGQDAQVLPEFRPMGASVDKSSRMRNRQGTGGAQKDGSYVVEESIEVNTGIFKSAQLEVRYWPDRNDSDGWAEKLVMVRD